MLHKFVSKGPFLLSHDFVANLNLSLNISTSMGVNERSNLMHHMIKITTVMSSKVASRITIIAIVCDHLLCERFKLLKAFKAID